MPNDAAAMNTNSQEVADIPHTRVYDAVFGDPTSLRTALTRQGCSTPASGENLTVFVRCCSLKWPFCYLSSTAPQTSTQHEAHKAAMLTNQATVRKIKVHMRSIHLEDPSFHVEYAKPRNLIHKQGVSSIERVAAIVTPPLAPYPSSLETADKSDTEVPTGASHIDTNTDLLSGTPASDEHERPLVVVADATPAVVADTDHLLFNRAHWDNIPGGKPAWEFGNAYKKMLGPIMLLWIRKKLTKAELGRTSGLQVKSVCDPTQYSDSYLAHQLAWPLSEPHSTMISIPTPEAQRTCEEYLTTLRAECLRRCMREIANDLDKPNAINFVHKSSKCK
jgi:hypothetical protein